MAYKYVVGPQIVDMVINDLKDQKFLDMNAEFEHGIMDNPGHKVYYNDYSFLDALGHYRQKEILEDIMDYLKNKNMIPSDVNYSNILLEMYHQIIRSKFIVPWKSFSPLMDKLVYLFSSIKMPKKCIAIGVNCGYTLGCIAGAYWKKNGNEPPADIYAIDLNRSNIKIAEKNISALDLNASFHFLTGDAYELLDKFESGTFDFAFLDTRRNYKILPKLYEKISNGGWLLMHNASDRHFVKEMKPFLEFVRNKEHFKESILFQIDTNGMELSFK